MPRIIFRAEINYGVHDAHPRCGTRKPEGRGAWWDGLRWRGHEDDQGAAGALVAPEGSASSRPEHFERLKMSQKPAPLPAIGAIR